VAAVVIMKLTRLPLSAARMNKRSKDGAPPAAASGADNHYGEMPRLA